MHKSLCKDDKNALALETPAHHPHPTILLLLKGDGLKGVEESEEDEGTGDVGTGIGGGVVTVGNGVLVLGGDGGCEGDRVGVYLGLVTVLKLLEGRTVLGDE